MDSQIPVFYRLIMVPFRRDSEGAVKMLAPKTIDRYKELSRIDVNLSLFDIFVAFTSEQFAKGLKTIRPLREGEKLINFGCGLFGTRDGVERYENYCKSRNEAIAQECDPQEVYFYEYNNHECMYDWEGDKAAIEKVIELFGANVAKSIKRFSEYVRIEEVMIKSTS